MNKGLRDTPKSMPNSKAYDDNYDRIFGHKQPERGRYRQDPETGKLLSPSEWVEKFGERKQVNAPYIQGDIDPFVSPASGEVVTSRSKHREDLKRTGCRIYEGTEQEKRYADRVKADKERQFEKQVSEAVEKTANDIKYGNTPVSKEPVSLDL